MAINNSTFLEGGTTSTTGGTAKTLVSQGSSSTRNDLYVNEDAVSATRRRVIVTAQPSRVQKTAPGGQTQERYEITLQQPKQLANLAWTTNQAKFALYVDPETTDAERLALKNQLLQIAEKAGDLVTKGNPQ